MKYLLFFIIIAILSSFAYPAIVPSSAGGISIVADVNPVYRSTECSTDASGEEQGVGGICILRDLTPSYRSTECSTDASGEEEGVGGICILRNLPPTYSSTECSPDASGEEQGVGGICIVTASCVNKDGDIHFACGPDGNPIPGCGDICDCDDDDPNVYPGAPPICNDGKDNDCDGICDVPIGGACSSPAKIPWKNNETKCHCSSVYTGHFDPKTPFLDRMAYSSSPLTWSSSLGNARLQYVASERHFVYIKDSQTMIIPRTVVNIHDTEVICPRMADGVGQFIID
jgi:hypothetical protein